MNKERKLALLVLAALLIIVLAAILILRGGPGPADTVTTPDAPAAPTATAAQAPVPTDTPDEESLGRQALSEEEGDGADYGQGLVDDGTFSSPEVEGPID
ncbi:MAG: hypothetical protein LBU67_02075 [Oscillospiraceae bacterium]|jgi:hypothetical protein|nr:hypothetical protein [Oscillospiraceae bacterium]